MASALARAHVVDVTHGRSHGFVGIVPSLRPHTPFYTALRSDKERVRLETNM